MGAIDRRAAFLASFPIIVALGAIVSVWWFAITQRTIEDAVDSPYLILGVFADRFPVLAVAVVYVIGHLLIVALTARRPFILIRLLAFAAAVALVLAATVYPTFGGFVARPAFIGGGMAIVNAAVSGSLVPTALGGALAGAVLAVVAAIARGIIDWGWGFRWGKLARTVLSLIAFMIMGVVLAVGWNVLVAGGALFPKAPLRLVDMVGLVGLIMIAAAPHLFVSAAAIAARKAKP